MTFLAQIDLATLPQSYKWPAPSTGLASFFFSQDWNGGDAERGPGVVLLQRGVLRRCPTPREADRFQECEVHLEGGLTIPEAQHGAVFLQDWEMTREEWSAYLDLYSLRREVLGDSSHQLFGHFAGDANDPLAELQAKRSRVNVLTISRNVRRYRTFLDEARAIQPIIRFDADPASGMAWGDGGMLGFFAAPVPSGPDAVWLYHCAG